MTDQLLDQLTDQQWMNYWLEEAVWRSDKHSCLQFALLKSTPGGFIAEFGVGKAATLNFLADMTDETVHGFDSFQGLPQDWRPGFGAKTFRVDDLRELRFAFNTRIWPGLFSETLPVFLDQVRAPARFIHIDCDLYQSTSQVLTALESRIVRGTVVQFDELWNYPGWEDHEYRALREFCKDTGKSFRFLSRTPGEQVAVMFH